MLAATEELTIALIHLIGGSPGAGKTTLGIAVARRIGCGSLTIDDIRTALLATTSSDEVPSLHVVGRPDAVTYFTLTSPEQMISDAIDQHTTLWPAIEQIVRKRVANRSPLVIDGWHLLPELIHGAEFSDVQACWLDVSHQELEKRERAVWDFYAASPDPERMFQNFLDRSIAWNDRMATQARTLGFRVIEQDGTATVEDMASAVLAD